MRRPDVSGLTDKTGYFILTEGDTVTIEQFQQQFTPVGDIIAIAIVMLLAVLLTATYVTRTKAFRLFLGMLAAEGLAAYVDLTYYFLICSGGSETLTISMIYVLRLIQHMSLFCVLFLFIHYLVEMLHLSKASRKRYFYTGRVGFILMVVVDILMTVNGKGFVYRPEQDYITEGNIIYAFVDAFFIGMILFILIRYRKRMVKQIFHGLITTMIFCTVIQTVQGLFHQTSFTTSIFTLPVIALMYLLHSSPYELTTGAVNEASFIDTVRELSAKKRNFTIMFLHIMDYEGYNTFSKEMQSEIFRFFTGIVKKSVLFRVAGGRLALVFTEMHNPDIITQLNMTKNCLRKTAANTVILNKEKPRKHSEVFY